MKAENNNDNKTCIRLHEGLNYFLINKDIFPEERQRNILKCHGTQMINMTALSIQSNDGIRDRCGLMAVYSKATLSLYTYYTCVP